MKAADYWMAVRCGAGGRGIGAAAVPAEVVLARLRYKLGPRLYALYSLSRKPVSTWSTYVDDGANKSRMNRVNPADRRRVVDDKIAFFGICRDAGLPAVPIVGVIAQDAVETYADINPVRSGEQLLALMRSHPDGLFIKPVGGSHGEGAFSVRLVGGAPRYLGRSTGVDELFAHCQMEATDARALLVQPRVRPASALQGVMSPHALGTVRAVTWLDGNSPRLLAACLRIPTGAAEADNFLHGASGNLVAAINLDTGCLRVARGSRRRDWPQIVEVATHPDTGIKFEGFRLPFWTAAQDLVLRAQRAFATLQTVGWDVAITDQGPLLVEGNGMYDVDLLQVALDEGLEPMLRRALHGLERE
jgi:hypothetical protein